MINIHNVEFGVINILNVVYNDGYHMKCCILKTFPDLLYIHILVGGVRWFDPPEEPELRGSKSVISDNLFTMFLCFTDISHQNVKLWRYLII